ncbi:MAG: NlpC/P60 family protein [Pseudomonadota bacterium]
MRDRRFWPANERVAHESLAGQVDLPSVAGEIRQVKGLFADLCCSLEDGQRDKQLLFGHAFKVLEAADGWAFGFDLADSYVGYLHEAALGAYQAPTHRVACLSSHIYAAPDVKSPDLRQLSYGSLLALSGRREGAWCALDGGGWVIDKHIAPLDEPGLDWVAEAERFLGVAYLWGGDSSRGIDCSGLIVAAMRAAGRDCPRDSDLQEAAFAETTGALQRGDLVFWKGHVGIMTDGETLLHANAYHMAVAKEPLAEAIERIGNLEFGAVTKMARPS